MTQATRRSSDFNPDELTKKSDQHDKLLTALEKRVGTNENFGKTFKEAASDSKAIDEAVEQTIIRLLKSSTETHDAVEQIIEKVDGRHTKRQWMGIGKIALWAVSIIATILITTWVNTVVNDAGNKSSSTHSASK